MGEYLLSTVLRDNSREIVDLSLPMLLVIYVIVQFCEWRSSIFSRSYGVICL